LVIKRSLGETHLNQFTQLVSGIIGEERFLSVALISVRTDQSRAEASFAVVDELAVRLEY
jgi:hypothetical protein